MPMCFLCKRVITTFELLKLHSYIEHGCEKRSYGIHVENETSERAVSNMEKICRLKSHRLCVILVDRLESRLNIMNLLLKNMIDNR